MILLYICQAIRKRLFFLLIIIIYLLSFTKAAFAADAIFFDAVLPSNYQLLSPSACEVPITCANTALPGQANKCGETCPADDSGSSGAPWTVYKLTCIRDEQGIIQAHYNKNSAVYSTADKCSDGSNNPPFEQYLRSGQCDGNIGGIYKTCCSNDGGISSNSCVPITPSSGAPTPPMDGVCPGGSYWVMCGVDQATCNEVNAIYGPGKCTTDACGPAVCGSIAPPSEPPPPDTPPPDIPPPDIPPPVCVANSWDSTLCATCKADGSGYYDSCSDFGPNSPSPGNDWCSCDQRCPGIDNPACTPTSSFVTQAPIQWLPPTCSGDSFSGCTLE